MSDIHEKQLLGKTVKRFVEEELFPHEELVDKTGQVPIDLGKQIEKKSKELGLFAANLPEDVGGGGLDYESMLIIEREYGKTSHALHSWAARPTEILLASKTIQVLSFSQVMIVMSHYRKLFGLWV